jgi:porphobilinogen synthase
MQFPRARNRRLRLNPAIRALTAENRLSREDFIQPLFVAPGTGVTEAIPSMPGVAHHSVDRLLEEARRLRETGILAVLLFGIPAKKDERGSEAASPFGAVQKAVAELKNALPELYVITDVCLCAYTSHGHCGLLEEGRIDNDASLKVLAQVALSHAKAGADMVAPSDMMDGRVDAIRRRLDEEGFHDTAIMAYSTKYASAFYGPFRDAQHSTPQSGDRRSYQMHSANAREAMVEMERDLREGADVLMVKPALPYLDVIHAARERFQSPIAAYHTSGEYAAVCAAAEKGWMDADAALMESVLSMRRAGAGPIISYAAKRLASLL